MTPSKEALEAAACALFEQTHGADSWASPHWPQKGHARAQAEAALTAALPHLAPQPTQSDVSRVLSISAYLAANCDAVDKGDGKARVTFKNANAVFLSALAAVRAEATLAEQERCAKAAYDEVSRWTDGTANAAGVVAAAIRGKP